MSRLVPFALAALLATSALAQTPQFSDPANLSGERVSPRTGRELPIDSGTLGLEQLLRKLNTRASILNIVAHPDDEDGGMLTLYARGLGARVADLSLTRGEGGQNAMTGDFEDALGLLRTQELLANDRYTGVTQMFGTEVDFGFSKTKSEAFAKWTHERVLYDVVRAIRIYRPLVITATFIGNPTDGHGQHQVSGEIAQETFVAAGDPNVFPELTKEGILPWQPLKMYARVPRGAISGKGLYDYATNQYVPAEFTNYITHVTTSTPPSANIVIHEGNTDPLLTNEAANIPPPADEQDLASFYAKRLSYVQFARLGLGLQRSQIGAGVRNAPSGVFDVAYHLYGSHLDAAHQNQHEDSFFDGIDTSLESIATLAPHLPASFHTDLKDINASISRAASLFDARQFEHPEQNEAGISSFADALADALKRLDALISSVHSTSLPAEERANVLHELRIKHVQLNQALADAFNLYISSDNSDTLQVAGQPLHLQQPPHLVQGFPGKLTFLRGYSRNSLDQGLSSPTPADAPNFVFGYPLDFPCKLTPAQTIVTRPYFQRDNIEQPVYRLSDPALRGAPTTPPALTCWAELECHGAHIQLGSVAVESVVPPVNIRIYDHAIILSKGRISFPVRLAIAAGSTPVTTVPPPITFDLPKGWTATLTKTNGSYREFRVDATPRPGEPVTIGASAVPSTGGPAITEGYQSPCYPGIFCTNFFRPAAVRIVPADLKLPDPARRRIAYIPGTGDGVVPALITLGIQPDVLEIHSEKGQPPQLWYSMGPADLSKYDTVILGVRTYNAHPNLHGAPTQALLDFARNGGNVVVQYQTHEFTAADAPYPLNLGSDEKVVDETAPVALLQTQNSLLTTPNQITPADFNNWIEERGHGFMSTWDPHYTALTETHDPGSPSEHVAPQLPQRGGLLTVQLGKGRWTYVAFALYRQLPEAVPGAYRLFLNLLDNPR